MILPQIQQIEQSIWSILVESLAQVPGTCRFYDQAIEHYSFQIPPPAALHWLRHNLSDSRTVFTMHNN